jgi:hypothetical protein
VEEMEVAIRSGSWQVQSESDPKWNGHGNTEACGGFAIPEEAKKHIEKMKRKLGREPPADLRYSYIKD